MKSINIRGGSYSCLFRCLCWVKPMCGEGGAWQQHITLFCTLASPNVKNRWLSLNSHLPLQTWFRKQNQHWREARTNIWCHGQGSATSNDLTLISMPPMTLPPACICACAKWRHPEISSSFSGMELIPVGIMVGATIPSGPIGLSHFGHVSTF